jgi:hypothetical protein
MKTYEILPPGMTGASVKGSKPYEILPRPGTAEQGLRGRGGCGGGCGCGGKCGGSKAPALISSSRAGLDGFNPDLLRASMRPQMPFVPSNIGRLAALPSSTGGPLAGGDCAGHRQRLNKSHQRMMEAQRALQVAQDRLSDCRSGRFDPINVCNALQNYQTFDCIPRAPNCDWGALIEPIRQCWLGVRPSAALFSVACDRLEGEFNAAREAWLDAVVGASDAGGDLADCEQISLSHGTASSCSRATCGVIRRTMHIVSLATPIARSSQELLE